MAQRSPRAGTTRWVSREKSCPCSKPEPIRDVTSASSEARDSREPRESFTPALRASVGACTPLGCTNVALDTRVRGPKRQIRCREVMASTSPQNLGERSTFVSAKRQGGKPRPCKNVALSEESWSDSRREARPATGVTLLRDAVAAGGALGRYRDGGGGGRPDR